jgi:hypothetical protein
VKAAASEWSAVLADGLMQLGHEVQFEEERHGIGGRAGEGVHMRVLHATEGGAGELALVFVRNDGAIEVQREWRPGFISDEMKKLGLSGAKLAPSPISKSELMGLASRLSFRTGGSPPKILSGGYRWSDANESATFDTTTEDTNVPMTTLVSLFDDGSWALTFFEAEEARGGDLRDSLWNRLYGSSDSLTPLLDEMEGDVDEALDYIDDLEARRQEQRFREEEDED